MYSAARSSVWYNTHVFHPDSKLIQLDYTRRFRYLLKSVIESTTALFTWLLHMLNSTGPLLSLQPGVSIQWHTICHTDCWECMNPFIPARNTHTIGTVIGHRDTVAWSLKSFLLTHVDSQSFSHIIRAQCHWFTDLYWRISLTFWQIHVSIRLKLKVSNMLKTDISS